MNPEKKNSTPGKTEKNLFMRLIEWIAEGAAKAQKGGGQCPT